MKVTYLIGAGASRNALPIVDAIPNTLGRLIEHLKTIDEEFFKEGLKEKRLTYSKQQIYDFFLQDFQWLLEQANRHASVDTFAKKLYIKGLSKELVKLKVVLSSFFVLEQARVEYDKRYDSFFASILTNSREDFPQNIRILSWNYDFQFEKAFSEYSDKLELSANQDYLNVISKYTYRKHKPNSFSIMKLNGTCDFYDTNWRTNYAFCNSLDNHISYTLLNEVLNNYALILHSNLKLYCGLSFAWESSPSEDFDIIEKSQSETTDTEILIVIGYSFPYFNRDIDRKIIANMPNLKRVYFQSPEAENLKERFLSILPNFQAKNMLARFDVDRFLLPNEL